MVTGSHLLVAVGRVANSDRLNTEAAGIDVDDKGYIVVDDHCRTSAEGVFALGDINGRGAFTHTSVNDAEIVLDLMRGGKRKLSDRIPAYGLFIDPALGRVGMTEKEAVAKEYKVLKATRPMSRISRAKEMGETLGFAKLLVDGNTDRILGAAILGPNGDEIVNMFAAYMYSGLPCSEYRRSVLIHPTISELMPWNWTHSGRSQRSRDSAGTEPTGPRASKSRTNGEGSRLRLVSTSVPITPVHDFMRSG